jgi:glutathione S-transferase
MLDLYHNINAVCAQKVRIALAEKGLTVQEHLMTLRGDQTEVGYLKLNPLGVVPTLLHDGEPIIESSLILYYLEEAFPEPSLMPVAPMARYRVRLFNKLIDERVHDACTIMTFATAFRPKFLAMGRDAWEADIGKSPSKKRIAYKRDVIERGLDSAYVIDAVEQFKDLIRQAASALDEDSHLAGPEFSIADVAVIPYFIRLELLKMDSLWDGFPSITEWVRRMRTRPSVNAGIFNRMEAQDWALFKNIECSPLTSRVPH